MIDSHPTITPHLPRPAFEVASLSALFALVESGAGFTLLPGIAALPALKQNLVFRPLHNPSMSRELYFICERKRSLTPAATQLASTIIEEFGALKKKPKLHGLMELAGGLSAFHKQLRQ
jgi:DNA-binding transcriptional LysR family regulator